jgi:gamma-glutamyltranspeptidase/glutathione hydrolase
MQKMVSRANAGFVRRIAGHLAIAPDTQIFKNMGVDVNVKIGDLVVQKDLAQSLREIATDGRAAFYEGRIAKQLIKGSEGWFNAEDLKAHTTRVLDPLSIKYRDLTVYGQPPPTQGMILMEELLINERFDIANLSEADRIHVGVESKKIGFSDRNAILGDPEFLEVNVERILSKKILMRVLLRFLWIRPHQILHPFPKEAIQPTFWWQIKMATRFRGFNLYFTALEVHGLSLKQGSF